MSKFNKITIRTICILLVLSIGMVVMLPILKEKHKWEEYFDRTTISPPSSLVVYAINGSDYAAPGNVVAFDLGAGHGNETKYLLEQGFKVYAIDFHERSMQSLRNRDDIKNYATLNIVHSDFQSLDWSNYPDPDIIVAINSISFLKSDNFNAVWQEITKNLKPGGIFVGRLFGDKLKWPNMDHMHLLSSESLQVIAQPYEVLYMKEVQEPQGNDIFQHAFEVVFKKK